MAAGIKLKIQKKAFADDFAITRAQHSRRARRASLKKE